MFQGGSVWKPPPLKRMKPPPLPELQEIVKKGQLSTRFFIITFDAYKYSVTKLCS